VPAAVLYIAVAMLLIALAPLPYGYYTLLRLVATAVFIWAALVSYQRKSALLPWVFAVMALLFNPVFKVYLPREAWMFIDLGAAALLLVTRRHLTEPPTRPAA
jgi:hypothetical protein